MTLGNRIKARRKHLGLSVDDVAAALGKNRATIYRYESQEIENLPASALGSLARVLRTTPADLMGWQFDPPSKKSVRLPVLGSMVAGVPVKDSGDIIDYEEIDGELASTGAFFALLIHDASMEPVLFKNDIVIVRYQPIVETGDIVVVCISDDNATVKKIRKEDGGVMLIGYNVAVYEPRFYTNDEIESLPVQILGKVIELRRKL